MYQQIFRIENGIGIAVMGADLHVYGDGVPLFLLSEWHGAPETDPALLAEPPSRMLNARFEVVGFTGRESELGQLRDWRMSRPRLAVRWLRGPGGAGKSRLAAQISAAAVADGWKVVTAVHGPGAFISSAASQDLRAESANGLLLVVDYAERWPYTHLMTLLSNRLLFHSQVRTRVLLIARTAEMWPAVAAELTDQQIPTSAQVIEPLPQDGEDRSQMFTAAREAFADVYRRGAATGLSGREIPADLEDLPPPVSLTDPAFGLTLAVHMAALVAVDARINGDRTPRDMAGLTIYLLNREHRHWRLLHGDPDYELNPGERTYRTPPSVMNHAVFAAALTGATDRTSAMSALSRLGLDQNPEQVVGDHAVCYPPPEAGLALEPLYPDRLAEDFLALTIPGHQYHAEYPDQTWAPATTAGLLARGSQARAASWTPRAVIFLAAAAERWPHVGEQCLYPVLLADPALAPDAGAAALSALSGLEDAPFALFEAVEPLLPRRSVELDTGIAAVARRLARKRLAETDDLQAQAWIHSDLAYRLANAGLWDEAKNEGLRAVRLTVDLAKQDPAAHTGLMATTMADYAAHLLAAGQTAEALNASRLAVSALKRLAVNRPGEFDAVLASSLQNLTSVEGRQGRPDPDTAAETVDIYRRLADDDPATFDRFLADALSNLASTLGGNHRAAQALAVGREGLEVIRRLAAQEPSRYEPDLAQALIGISFRAADMGHDEEAERAAAEAVRLLRIHAAANRDVYQPELARALGRLAGALGARGRYQDALVQDREATAVCRELADRLPAVHEPQLALSLHNEGVALSRTGRHAEALERTRESAAVWRRLAEGDADAYSYRLAHALTTLAVHLGEYGQAAEALSVAEEAVAIHERLAASDPGPHRVLLAEALANLSGYLSAVGRREAALDAAERAVEGLRQAAEDVPAVRPALAIALNKLGLRREDAGRQGAAIEALSEAVALYRSLVAAHPGLYEDDLAGVSENLAWLLRT